MLKKLTDYAKQTKDNFKFSSLNEEKKKALQLKSRSTKLNNSGLGQIRLLTDDFVIRQSKSKRRN